MSNFHNAYKTLLVSIKEEAVTTEDPLVLATLKKLYKVVRTIAQGGRTREDVRKRLVTAIEYLKQYRTPKAKQVTSELNNLYALI